MYPGDFKPVHHTFVPVSRMMIMTRCLRSGKIILRKPWDLLVVLSVIMTFGNTRCFLRLFSKAVDLGTLGTQTHKPIPHTTSYLILWTKMPLCLSFFDHCQVSYSTSVRWRSGVRPRLWGSFQRWWRGWSLSVIKVSCLLPAQHLVSARGEKRWKPLSTGIRTLWLL